MNCRNQITHIVQEGESLYKIAQRYNMSMGMVMEQNPGLSPYNLQIGTVLQICLDQSSGGQEQWGDIDYKEVMELNNDMREVWIQHVYWTRMLLISIADRLRDQMAVTNRLLENPKDIAEVFGEFYPEEVTNTITRLLTDHLRIGSAWITAMRDGRTAEAAMLIRQWYENADQMARAFSSINPQYKEDEVREMLYHHLTSTQNEVGARLAGNYNADIQAFDEVEESILEMADYFTSGLVKQFPQNF